MRGLGIIACIVAGMLASTALAVPHTATLLGLPELPKTDACTPQNLSGLWRLQRVFELPTGTTLQQVEINPQQYLRFHANGTFSKVEGGTLYSALADYTNTASRQPDAGTLQYVLGQKGMIYFYRKSIAYDALHCTIAAENKEPFHKDDLLLQLTGAPNQKLLKIYRRTAFQ